jgi:hypothetical protein
LVTTILLPSFTTETLSKVPTRIGFRDSTIISYVGHDGMYLEFACTEYPSADTPAQFRNIHEMKEIFREAQLTIRLCTGKLSQDAW